MPPRVILNEEFQPTHTVILSTAAEKFRPRRHSERSEESRVVVRVVIVLMLFLDWILRSLRSLRMTREKCGLPQDDGRRYGMTAGEGGTRQDEEKGGGARNDEGKGGKRGAQEADTEAKGTLVEGRKVRKRGNGSGGLFLPASF